MRGAPPRFGENFLCQPRKPRGSGCGARSSGTASGRALPYGELYAALGCVWEGVEAPPDELTTTGTSAAMVCEMAVASELAITGVSDVNRFTTVSYTHLRTALAETRSSAISAARTVCLEVAEDEAERCRGVGATASQQTALTIAARIRKRHVA